MIVKWIARALARGEDHLTLTKAELSEWQANGCRVRFGTPNGKHRHYQLRQINRWRTHLIERLIEMDPLQWPIGELVLESHGNKTSVSMPRCDFQNVGDDFWKVPLIPEDVDHRIDAWSFDISLSDEELEAVRPIAHQLAKRTSLRNQFHASSPTSREWLNQNTELSTIEPMQPGVELERFLIELALRSNAEEPVKDQ